MDRLHLKRILTNGDSYINMVPLIKRYATKRQSQKWSIKVAESVLHVYENRYPNDSRIRDCIQATKDYLNGKISKDKLLNFINTNNGITYVIFGERDYNPAAYAAHAASYAADAAVFVDSANHAAYAAAHAAVDAANNKEKQEKLNIQLMIDTLEIKIPDTKVARKLYKNQIRRREKGVLVL